MWNVSEIQLYEIGNLCIFKKNDFLLQYQIQYPKKIQNFPNKKNQNSKIKNARSDSYVKPHSKHFLLVPFFRFEDVFCPNFEVFFKIARYDYLLT